MRLLDASVRMLESKNPGQQPSEYKNRVRHIAVARQLGELSENDGEDDHRQERADDCPRDPDDSLLISNSDVAPREDGEQLAIVPEVGPIVALGLSGFKDE